MKIALLIMSVLPFVSVHATCTNFAGTYRDTNGGTLVAKQSGCESVELQWINADGSPTLYDHHYSVEGNHDIFRYDDGGLAEDNSFTLFSDHLEFDRVSDTRNTAYPNAWYNFTSSFTITDQGDLQRECFYFQKHVIILYKRIN